MYYIYIKTIQLIIFMFMHIYLNRLVHFIMLLKSKEYFSYLMANAIICVGISSNDNCDILNKFKALKADVLINCNGFIVYAASNLNL